MQVRELVQPSSTCDIRGHLDPVVPPHAEAASTPIDADLHAAAAEMLIRRTSTLLVLDRDVVAGVVTIADLLRGALELGDQQLCRDLIAQMQDSVADVPLSVS